MDTRVTIRVDENEKRQVEAILNEIGLNLSSATNIFYKAIIRQKGLPFEVKITTPSRIDQNTKVQIIDELSGVLCPDTDLDKAKMERLS